MPARLFSNHFASMQLGMQYIKIMAEAIAGIIERAAEVAIGIVVNQADGDLGQP